MLATEKPTFPSVFLINKGSYILPSGTWTCHAGYMLTIDVIDANVSPYRRRRLTFYLAKKTYTYESINS